MKITAVATLGLVATVSAQNSTVSTTVNASMTSSAASAMSSAQCQAQFDSCRVQYEANHSTCAAQFAGCLGYNPFASNGTNTVTSNAGSVLYTTQVVTALTTYCPAATTLTIGNQVYTVSSATTLTITDCPCTITKASTMPVATGSSTWTASSSGARNASVTTYKPVMYTGAAVQLAGAGSGLFAAVAGAAMLL